MFRYLRVILAVYVLLITLTAFAVKEPEEILRSKIWELWPSLGSVYGEHIDESRALLSGYISAYSKAHTSPVSTLVSDHFTLLNKFVSDYVGTTTPSFSEEFQVYDTHLRPARGHDDRIPIKVASVRNQIGNCANFCTLWGSALASDKSFKSQFKVKYLLIERAGVSLAEAGLHAVVQLIHRDTGTEFWFDPTILIEGYGDRSIQMRALQKLAGRYFTAKDTAFDKVSLAGVQSLIEHAYMTRSSTPPSRRDFLYKGSDDYNRRADMFADNRVKSGFQPPGFKKGVFRREIMGRLPR